jgi:ribokinase
VTPRAVVIGSLNMDLVMRLPRLPGPGETLFGHGFSQSEGGKGANQAVAAARLGASIAMVGCVGADGFGAQLLAALAADGCDTSHVARLENAATGIAMILVEDSGENRIMLAAGANLACGKAQVDQAAALIAAAKLVALQLEIPMATVSHAAGLARRGGARVLLNPAPSAALPDDLWPSIDLLVPNETEAASLSGIAVDGPAAAAAAARLLRARGVGEVIVTLGAKGVLIATDEGELHLPARAVAATDTTAAGDCFIGGLIAGLTAGQNLHQAALLGMEAAAICVTRAGARRAMPYRCEISF